MDPNQLFDLVNQHKWVALAAFLIGLVVRLLKSDTKIPIDVPVQYRVWLALALGAFAGVLDKFAEQLQNHQVTWTSALVQGLIAAAVAIVSHNAVIESLNGGKELNVPGLIKPGYPPSEGKPPTLPPPSGPYREAAPVEPIVVVEAEEEKPTPPPAAKLRISSSRLRLMPAGARAIVFGMAVAVLIAGCQLFTPANLPNTVLTFEQVSCILEHAFIDNKTMNTVCNLLDPASQLEAEKIATKQREAVGRKMSEMHAAVCDAGATDASSKSVCGPGSLVSCDGGVK